MEEEFKELMEFLEVNLGQLEEVINGVHQVLKEQ